MPVNLRQLSSNSDPPSGCDLWWPRSPSAFVFYPYSSPFFRTLANNLCAYPYLGFLFSFSDCRLQRHRGSSLTLASFEQSAGFMFCSAGPPAVVPGPLRLASPPWLPRACLRLRRLLLFSKKKIAATPFFGNVSHHCRHENCPYTCATQSSTCIDVAIRHIEVLQRCSPRRTTETCHEESCCPSVSICQRVSSPFCTPTEKQSWSSCVPTQCLLQESQFRVGRTRSYSAGAGSSRQRALPQNSYVFSKVDADVQNF